MGTYEIQNASIIKACLNGETVTCFIATVNNCKSILAKDIFVTTSPILIQQFKPYLSISDGGVSNKETIIPKEIKKISNVINYEHNLNGIYVKKYNKFSFYGTSILVTSINGIEYLEALPTPEEIGWFYANKNPISYFDDMKPMIYSKISFLCKYDYEHNKSLEKLSFNQIGEIVKSLFFEQYDSQKHSIVHCKHNINLAYQSTQLEQNTTKYVEYDIPNLTFVRGNFSLDFDEEEYRTNNMVYPILLFPKKGTLVYPFRQTNKSVARKGKTEEAFFKLLKKVFASSPKYQYDIINNATLHIEENKYPLVPDIAIIGKNDKQNIRIDIEIDEPYEGGDKKPIHFIDGPDEQRNKKMTERGWCVIRFAEEQIFRYKYECISFICYVLQNIDSYFVLPKDINEESLKDEILPKVMRWSKENANSLAMQNYRESYLGVGLGSVEISEHYMAEELLLTEIEKASTQIKNKTVDTMPIACKNHKNKFSFWFKFKEMVAFAFRLLGKQFE